MSSISVHPKLSKGWILCSSQEWSRAGLVIHIRHKPPFLDDNDDDDVDVDVDVEVDVDDARN